METKPKDKTFFYPFFNWIKQRSSKRLFSFNYINTNFNFNKSIIKKYTNSKECIAVNSGTAALHLALILLGVIL